MNRIGTLVALMAIVTALSWGARSVGAKTASVAATPYSFGRSTGERPSWARRDFGNTHRTVTFPGPIQHVVVIYMENRTADDLFSGYFNVPFPRGGTFGSALDLRDPNVAPTLAPNPIGAYFDPDHSHHLGFVQ
jgi:phospholipase C